ncbi:hypothetical protein QFC19_009129 [Naganishia cerealis]|uniref:Uncharacterized protein n=1 Tax=Naganishia cerealis TaxID=610337 RepID=A0ACC2UWF9_9TREE|nr:hypothetical protein QFC19_009129 [Naganishia cerealis]
MSGPTFANFFDRFPKPRTEPGTITVDELAALMRTEGQVAGKTFVVVDVRRMDLEDPERWYADYLAAHPSAAGDSTSEALVLQGGIKAWLASEHGRTVAGVKDVLGDYRDSRL